MPNFEALWRMSENTAVCILGYDFEVSSVSTIHTRIDGVALESLGPVI